MIDFDQNKEIVSEVVTDTNNTSKIKIIIGGYFGFHNIGDEAILDSMMHQISSLIPTVEFIALSENPDVSKKMHGIEAIGRTDYKKISQEVENSDLVILGGGGLFEDHDPIDISSIFTSDYGVANYGILPLIAKMHNKPVLYYSQGFGPLFSKEAVTFVSFVSRLADAITVRDGYSENLLEDLGIANSKIHLAADPAITLRLASDNIVDGILAEERIPSGVDLICISVRWWIDRELEERYIIALSESLDKLLFNNNLFVIFIPFARTVGIEDTIIINRILDRMKNKVKCRVINGSYHPTEIAGIISRSKLLIGMRYHSIIFSYISRIPFVALSYDPKVRNFVEEIGLGNYCIDANLITSSALDVLISSAFENWGGIRSKMELSFQEMEARSRKSSTLILPLIEDYSPSNYDISTLANNNELFSILSTLSKKVHYLSSKLMSKDVELHSKNAELHSKDAELHSKDAELHRKEAKLQNDIIELRKTHEKLQDMGLQLTNKDLELQDLYIKLQNKELELNNNENRFNDLLSEVGILRATLNQRESSLSWRFSQWYGKYFPSQSILTRFLKFFINKISPIQEKQIEHDYELDLNKILKDHENGIKGIIVYPPTVGWNIPLFQRPQQLALKLSDIGYLFFFCTGNNELDGVDGFDKIGKNCYLTDKYYLLISKLQEFVLFLSSTNSSVKINDVEELKKNAVIIYDYIDEISSDITRDSSISELQKRHDYLINNADIFIVTADSLYEGVRCRSDRDIFLIPNGVDYEHFHIRRNNEEIPSDLKPIISKNNPIIGYYGAFATWFDYNLLIKLASKRPDYEILLIGWDYDNSMSGKLLDSYQNIHYLGVKNYRVLPKYASWFNVSTIPFVLNKITESTSPIKIFEYMALGKPIVTTDMRECRKYESVIVASDYMDFIHKVDDALKLENDESYLETLDHEAKNNTWNRRAKEIDKLLYDSPRFSRFSRHIRSRNDSTSKSNPYKNLKLLKPIKVNLINRNYYNKLSTINIKFSLVLPVKNESKSVLHILDNIENQKLLPDELIIVEGGSSDNTVQLIEEFMRETSLNIKLIRAESGTLAEQRNLGLKAANNEILILTDAVTIPADYCLNLIGPLMEDNDIDLVAGIYYSEKNTPWDHYYIYHWDILDFNEFVPSAKALLIRKNLALSFGGFPEFLEFAGEDTLFTINYRKYSSKWVINKNAFVYWDPVNGDKETAIRKAYSYGVGDGQNGVGNCRFYEQLVRYLDGDIISLGDPVNDAAFHGYLEGRKNKIKLLFKQFKLAGNILILSGIPFSDSGGGQRGTQVALEFMKRNFTVTFVNIYPSYEVHKEIYIDFEYHFLDLYSLDDFHVGDYAERYNEMLGNTIIIVEMPHPKFLSVIQRLKDINPNIKVIYDLIDNWDSSLGSDWYSKKTDVELMGNSDLFFASAKYLVEKLQESFSHKIHLIPNAVNTRLFNSLAPYKRPRDLPTNGTHIVVYIGALWGEWFDWDLLEYVSTCLKDTVFVIIGNIPASNKRYLEMRNKKNVVFLGLKGQFELPAYLYYSDACIIPFKYDEKIIKYTNPLKVYEYLSMKRPVISTYMDELDGISAVFLANDYGEFKYLLENILNKTIPVQFSDEFIYNNSWIKRVDDILDILSDENININ